MNENKNDFAKLSLSASMLGNLEQLGYLQMTAIQAASLKKFCLQTLQYRP
jgi:superfamily II DNA/RNA helicase